MNTERLILRKALPSDMAGILKLQKANQIAQGGSLSAELPEPQIARMLADMPQIVACRGEEIVGFLLATSQTLNRQHPVAILDKTLEAFPAAEADAYFYGPVCVSASERGKGLAQRLFATLLAQVPGRQGVLFIKDDNQPSLNAHRKMGMSPVGHFHFNTGLFHVFAYKAP